MVEKAIVVSAVNIFEGGPLSILNDCLETLSSKFGNEFKIIALVHDKRMFSHDSVEYIDFPKSRKRYVYRLFYEYVYFSKLSVKIRPYLWLSLHDITPNVKARYRCVYCHNVSAFYKFNIKEFLCQPTVGFFSLFYKWLYHINLKKNRYVIVQSFWAKKLFQSTYKLKSEKIIVANPVGFHKIKMNRRITQENSATFTFFYPSFPRVFKNFEVICEATNLLNSKCNLDFRILLTLDGTENKYSKLVYKKYRDIKNIHFIGLQKREQIFEIYSYTDCLLFPSKLESWGLPISEFKYYDKPIITVDQTYSRETLGNYKLVNFFNPNNSRELCEHMYNNLVGNNNYEGSNGFSIEQPYAENWDDLFVLLLKNVLGNV